MLDEKINSLKNELVQIKNVLIEQNQNLTATQQKRINQIKRVLNQLSNSKKVGFEQLAETENLINEIKSLSGKPIKVLLESAIESHFVKKCKKHGLLQYKFSSPAVRSVPDRLLIHNGITQFIEFKATGKTPTEKQSAEHFKICSAGAKVWIAFNDKSRVNSFKAFFSLSRK